MSLKVAFEKYIELQSSHRRQLMLSWCLEMSTMYYKAFILKSSLLPLPSNRITTNRTSKPTSLKSSNVVFSYLSHFKRDLSNSKSLYFHNNIELLVNESSASKIGDKEKLQSKVEEFFDILQKESKKDAVNYFSQSNHYLSLKRTYLFNRALESKFYSLAHKLLLFDYINDPATNFNIPNSDIKDIIKLIDTEGSIKELSSFLQYKMLSGDLEGLDNILENALTSFEIILSSNDFSQLKSIMQLTDLIRQTKTKKITHNILSSLLSSVDELHKLQYENSLSAESNSIITLLLTYSLSKSLSHIYNKTGLIKNRDHNQETINLIDGIVTKIKENVSIHNFDDIHPQYIASVYQCLRIFKLKNDSNICKEYMSRQSFENQLSSINCILNRSYSKFESFILWFDCYYFPNKSKIDIMDTPVEESVHCKSLVKNKVFSINYSLDSVRNVFKLDEMCSDALSVLLYGSVRNSRYIEKIYQYKSTHKELTVMKHDRVNLVKNLTNLKQFKDIFKYVEIDPKNFINDKTYEHVLMTFSKTDNWSQLRQLFNRLYSKGELPGKSHYTVLFYALASRGETSKVLEFWDQYLKRGFPPDSKILTLIIKSFVVTKSYSNALQWFESFTHYDVPMEKQSYELLLETLSGAGNIQALFKLLDELKLRDYQEFDKNSFNGCLKRCAEHGYIQTVDKLITHYVTDVFKIDMHETSDYWRILTLYYTNRYSQIVDLYFFIKQSSGLVNQNVYSLVLNSASRLPDTEKYFLIWEDYLLLRKQTSIPHDASCFSTYLQVYYKINGTDNLTETIDKLTNDYSFELTTNNINDLLFSTMMNKSPSDAVTILEISSEKSISLNSKTFSLLTQALLSEKTNFLSSTNIKLANKIATKYLLSKDNTRKGLSFRHRDFDPFALKLLVKENLRHNSAAKARHLFQSFVDSSKNYIYDNPVVLSTELMILSFEKRWRDFESAFERYLSILKDEYDMLESTYKSSFSPTTHLESVASPISNIAISNPTNPSSSKIPASIKNGLFDVWEFRLKQLEDTNRLHEVLPMLQQLQKEGFIFSNKNINDTAIYMSKDPKLIKQCVEFTDSVLLPGRKSEKILRRHELIGNLPETSSVPYSEIRLTTKAYIEIIGNIQKNLLNEYGKKRLSLLANSYANTNHPSILKNLSHFISNSSYWRYRHRKDYIAKIKKIKKKSMASGDGVSVHRHRIDRIMSNALKQEKQKATTQTRISTIGLGAQEKSINNS
ncbi:hypothetical protein BVG19_g150 [[Candida] boidinii]|nr:hypothetical protein BVG19_g150 [[Candida] boidinii]OWB49718.1 hypothetical protein B5S27_g1260 [[Candida] boidinii]